jgi:hypothetical protein
MLKVEYGSKVTQTSRKISVNATSRMVSAISLGGLTALRPFDHRDHTVEERLTRVGRHANNDPIRQNFGAAGY